MTQPSLFDDCSRGAEISDCGRYRFRLWRRWADGPPLLWIMLNPSTADGTGDDPTIRRCVAFSKREGFGGLRVVNLYALRATSPADLWASADRSTKRNDEVLAEEGAAASRVIFAWGSGRATKEHRAELHRRGQFALSLRADAECLGRTDTGEPRHPLMLRADAPLVPAWGAP